MKAKSVRRSPAPKRRRYAGRREHRVQQLRRERAEEIHARMGILGGDAKRDIEDNINNAAQRAGTPTWVYRRPRRTLAHAHHAVAGLTQPRSWTNACAWMWTMIAELQANALCEWNRGQKARCATRTGWTTFYQLQQLAYLSAQMNGDAFALLQTEDEPGMPYKACGCG